MAPRISMEAKLALLTVIKNNKDILFGRFSSDIDNMHKQEKWEEVLLKSKSLGICNETRDRNFVRDKVYGTWKSRTLDKLDKVRNTGQGLDYCDCLMLEIIGKERPEMEGFSLGEILPMIGEEDEPGAEEDEYQATPSGDGDGGGSDDFSSEDNLTNTTTTTPGPSLALLDKKRKLELEYLELNNYKKRLEILKLEMELGVPQSAFTQEFGMIVKTLRNPQKSLKTVARGGRKSSSNI